MNNAIMILISAILGGFVVGIMAMVLFVILFGGNE